MINYVIKNYKDNVMVDATYNLRLLVFYVPEIQDEKVLHCLE